MAMLLLTLLISTSLLLQQRQRRRRQPCLAFSSTAPAFPLRFHKFQTTKSNAK
jgi:hypothetical protein